MSYIEEKIKQLSPSLRQEIEDFIEFLIKKHQHREHKTLKFDWAGALKNMRGTYTSVDLQHDITKLRIREK